MVYLCGNPEMIAETKEKMISKGVSGSLILHERFA